MTLFGTTLDAEQIAALLSLLALLVFWLVVLRRERGYARWFKQWEADRKARREAEQAAEKRGASPDGRKGPWG
ncbi:hypothetical protein [Brevundimonas sp.]|uniref:hypothetical protein n=1 Tax=Brevundimonas sp. TaxID=1871086 RepID=UPI002FD9D52C